MAEQNAQKEAAGKAAAALVEDGMVVGLGTGSTVHHTVVELGRRVREEDLEVMGIPTSRRTELLAKEAGIGLSDLDRHPEVDLTIDGADEFDLQLRLIKGGGGALTREKIVWRASQRCVAVADASKQVKELGSTFPLPIEVLDLGKTPVLRMLERLGAEATVRTGPDGVFLTDQGNPIVDAKWPRIEEPEELELRLEAYPGVVCTGLFLDLCERVFVGGPDGVRQVRPRW